jgi:outer membrane protein OmpA-like peptidoglycan-associated protein
VVKRFKGSLILSYEKKNYDTATFPLSKLESVAGKRDNHNNAIAEPKLKKTVEGETTHLTYVMPAERSSLEVSRYFQDAVKAKGGTILYECKAPDCGGNPTGNSLGGGGNMSLPMYIRSGDKIGEANGSIPSCAASEKLTDLRYFLAELPSLGAFVSIQTATAQEADGTCGALKGRTLAVVDVVKGKTVENLVPAIPSTSLSLTLGKEGKVALYSFEFDTKKATLKPSADPSLAQIAQLLTEQPQLKLLVVGHTDSEGGYKANVDLSKKRADAIVSALVSRHKIKRDRLTAVGVSSAAPLVSNKTPEGRAKNRRVELVEN